MGMLAAFWVVWDAVRHPERNRIWVPGRSPGRPRRVWVYPGERIIRRDELPKVNLVLHGDLDLEDVYRDLNAARSHIKESARIGKASEAVYKRLTTGLVEARAWAKKRTA